ncbi:RxLR-like protein [Plasmopara halstedii]|uniref:RxLR effector protein n=1 Tax=Plasmopara halstedii TaxID=4781 RepID=A0A0P1AND3_PLAHL|nr:RxLR-like protein [Plasmopara halstedii]CEG42328.1 RxLR-like protein [Plasmopara halstedii]|eukprot:XP_024578697.1 RxLR-like protein [Plasmopara halstedii]
MPPFCFLLLTASIAAVCSGFLSDQGEKQSTVSVSSSSPNQNRLPKHDIDTLHQRKQLRVQFVPATEDRDDRESRSTISGTVLKEITKSGLDAMLKDVDTRAANFAVWQQAGKQFIDISNHLKENFSEDEKYLEIAQFYLWCVENPSSSNLSSEELRKKILAKITEQTQPIPAARRSRYLLYTLSLLVLLWLVMK